MRFDWVAAAAAIALAAPAMAEDRRDPLFQLFGTVVESSGLSFVGGNFEGNLDYDALLAPTSLVPTGGGFEALYDDVPRGRMTTGGADSAFFVQGVGLFGVNAPDITILDNVDGSDRFTLTGLSVDGSLAISLDYLDPRGLAFNGADLPTKFMLYRNAYSNFTVTRVSDGAFARIVGQIRQISVPEPSTWAMLILGFGLVGAAMRRAPASALTT